VIRVLFDDAIELAIRYGMDKGGMASVSVSWNPYLGSFQAEASWSDNVRLVGEAFREPEDALASLIARLEIEIEASNSNIL